LVWDDVPKLQFRVQRLLSGKAYAQEPASRTLHMVGNVRVEPGEGDVTTVRSSLAVFEARLERDKHFFAGHCVHRLRQTDAGIRIVEKRVFLIDNDQYMREIAFII
jgi:3-phenylpropionate/cinnamic acid dioxygenase small subunit